MKRTSIPKLNELLDKHGWIITGVPGGALYTVGMVDMLQHPEIMIHGLNPAQAEGLLRSAVVLLGEGHSFQVPDSTHAGVVRGMLVKSIPVHPSNYWDWMGQALDYHNSQYYPRPHKEEMEAVQLLWPDTQGNFPGDSGYESRFDCQRRFDSRRPEYDQIEVVRVPGHSCAACDKEL